MCELRESREHICRTFSRLSGMSAAVLGIYNQTKLARAVLVASAILVSASAGTVFGSERAGAYRPHLDLTLADTISLTLQNNIGLINAHLNRVVQRYSLKVAEDKFVPDATIVPFVRHEAPGDAEERTSGGISSQVSVHVPTGGRLVLTWDNVVDEGRSESWSSNWALNYTQPLLKGAGVPVNTASVKMARIAEERNILALKSTVMQTVSSVIVAYRRLIQAERRLEISTRSLERAKEQLEVSRLLIQSGKMAERDIIQTEETVASRELDLVRARNGLDDARLALIDLLDIDARTQIRPTDSITIDPVVPDVEQSIKVAYEHRPDWLQSLLAVEVAELDLILAENNRLWDLSASVGATFDNTSDSFDPFSEVGKGDYSARLNLNIPIGDLTRQQRYLNASIALRRTKNDLAELRQMIEVNVRNAVRDVEVLLLQVDLAQRRRELAEQKSAVEKDKLNRGLSTNFRVSSFEDDLLQAQNSEVDTIISYLNALTSLDRTLGTMLETWEIDITGTDGQWNENP